MKRIGEIKEVHGSKMTVEFCNHESCENCHGCEGGQSTAVLEMDASGRVGDFAEVEMPTGNVVKASLLVYIFPLLGFLTGMASGFRRTAACGCRARRAAFASDCIPGA